MIKQLILSWVVTAIHIYPAMWYIFGVSITLKQITGVWLLIMLYRLVIRPGFMWGV